MKGFMRYVITKQDDEGHIVAIQEVHKCVEEQEISNLYKEIKTYSPAVEQKEQEEANRRQQEKEAAMGRIELLEEQVNKLTKRIEELEEILDSNLETSLKGEINND